MEKLTELLPKALKKLEGQGFNEMGIRHPLWHLHVIGSFIAYLPSTVQEKYADAVAVAFPDMAAEGLKRFDVVYTLDVPTYLQINATGIGNIAYIANHAKKDSDKEKAGNILNVIREFATNNIDEIVAMIVSSAKEAIVSVEKKGAADGGKQ